MKKVSVILLSLCLISCASVHLPVPGENEVKKSNIYVEYMTIADGYNDQAKYDKAITYYKLAMKSRKLYWSCYYKIGKAYALNKNWDEAQKVYAKLHKRDPENISIEMALAYISAMNGKLSAAEEIYAYLWKDNPENEDVLSNYINVLLAEEKYEEASVKVKELKEKFHENSNISSFEKKLEEINNAEQQEKVNEEKPSDNKNPAEGDVEKSN